MQPASGSVEWSADHSPQRIPEQFDSERIGEQSDSSAVQPAQHVFLLLPESSSTPRPHEYGVYGYNYEQATPVHPPDLNSASSVSGQSSVERRAYESQAPVVSAHLSELLRQRYQKPGRPSSVGGSRQAPSSAFGTASRPDSLDSAEQPVSSRIRQANPQSGDSAPCHGGKPPPPVLKAPPPKPGWQRAAFKAPPPNGSLPLHFGGYHNPTSFVHGHRAPHSAGDPRRNTQEPNRLSKASSSGVPQRVQLFIISSSE